MESVHEEYIWNERDDVLIYEKDGVQKRVTLEPNKLMTRSCHADASKYLIGKLEDAGRKYEMYVKHLEQGYCNFCEVLAVGKGRKWSKRESKRFNVASNWTIPVEVGDFVLMPEHDRFGRMWRYIFGKPYLHIAEFHVPILIIQKENSDD